jgi:signal transduction histidine kinase
MIGGVRATVKRASPAAPGLFPAGRPVAGELAAFGLRALDAVGARLALVFLGTALVGILLVMNPARSAAALVLLSGVAVAGCAAGVAVVLIDRLATSWTLVLAVAASVTTALLATVPPGMTWDQSHTVAAWVVAGMSSGVAASRGPVLGLVVFAPAVVTSLGAEQAHGGPVSALIFLGALTYYTGGAITNVLARRGFATTERALAAVETAETAQRVAEERWHARREADRLLHDTVLATLTVLAHEGVGVAAADIRAACGRDLDVLTGGVQDAGKPVILGRSPDAPEPEHGMTVEPVVEQAVAHAAALGLELSAHLGALERQEDRPPPRLDPPVAAALNDALAECITNVRLHSGVGRLDLVVSSTAGALVILVVDEGRGFDPAAVPDDRLGLRASVLERLSSVGGSGTVWSRPDQGTSVKLRLPLSGATS